MWGYLKAHERLVEGHLGLGAPPHTLLKLKALHEKRISFLQHERLVHLLVTLFVALFFLLTAAFALLQPTLPSAALAVLLLILTVAYLLHYYRLENGVQRLYRLSDRLDERIASSQADDRPA